jgi:hypothetical protein
LITVFAAWSALAEASSSTALAVSLAAGDASLSPVAVSETLQAAKSTAAKATTKIIDTSFFFILFSFIPKNLLVFLGKLLLCGPAVFSLPAARARTFS